MPETPLPDPGPGRAAPRALRWRVRALLLGSALLGAAGCGPDRPGTSSGTDPAPAAERTTLRDSVVELHDSTAAVPQVPSESEKLGIAGRRVQAGDVSLFVIDSGVGTPVVLINGGPGNTLQTFLPEFLAASRFARVILYDQRGTGLSEWKRPPSGYSTAQAVADLDALRRALGIDRWVVLGHSYGGLIAQWYALDHPESTLALVLVASSVGMSGLELGERDFRTDEERTRIRAAYTRSGNFIVPTHSDRADLETVASLVYNGYLNGDWKRQYYYRPSRERMAHVARHEWRHDRNYNAETRADGFERDLTGAFAQRRVPTFIVEGYFDPNWGTQKPLLLAQQIPGSQVLVLARSAHFPFEEQPEAFFGALERFLAAQVPGSDP